MADAVEYAQQNGVLVVAAAGNENQDAANVSPGGLPGVLTAGAIDELEELAWFSNYGYTVEVVAPGVFIMTTDIGNTYGEYSGTSFSAPFVSALAAMCKIKEPEVTAEKLFYAITNSAVDLGEPGRDEMYGFGKVNAQAALQKIDEPYVPVTGVTVIPEILEMEVGEVAQLTAEVMPENATNKNVKWLSDNEEIAIVDEDGVVTAIATGVAVITAITDCGGYIDTLTVVVGTAEWYPTGLWHIAEHVHDGVFGSWWYGDPATNNYDTGEANSGTLTSFVVDLTGATDPVLKFSTWWETEQGTIWDKKIVQISIVGETGWIDLKQIYEDNVPIAKWTPVEIDLSAYAGQEVMIRFYFDTVDSLFNDYWGWFVTDIVVEGVESYIPVTGVTITPETLEMEVGETNKSACS